MKNYVFLLVLLTLVSCKESQKFEEDNVAPKKVTSQIDYEKFLNYQDTTGIKKLEREIDSLRNRLEKQPIAVGDLSRISSRYNSLYDQKADIKNLILAVESKENQVKYLRIMPEGARMGLAQMYIKQHKFKKADSLMKTFATGKLSPENQMVYFDIAMELGDYTRAEKMLDSLKNTNDYNYLIRAAKWNDHKGDLSATIRLMEKAKELANQSGNPSLQLWSNSNIADYYGHDGQLVNSYEHYLKTLKQDPSNTYALKGIAWIVYSHEKNPEEALRILNTLKKRHPLPDYDLAIAEIKEYQGKTEEAEKLRLSFLEEVKKPLYGGMYNTYKIEQLLNGDEQEKEQALAIARQEIENRSTPETQSLLSYALLKNGQKEQALKNQKQFVIDKTFEPVAQLHSLEILMANSMEDKTTPYKEELSGAGYELGPVTMKNFNKIVSKK